MSAEMPGQLTKVQEKRLKKAKEAGIQAISTTTHFLETYKDDINPERLQEIVESERLRAEKEYLDETLRGLHNDGSNSDPGITAIVRSDGISKVFEILERKGLSGNFDTPVFEDIPESQSQLERMRLPFGWYVDSRSAMLFTTSEHRPDGKTTQRNGFIMPMTDVIRIEGDSSGEFWQNPEFIYDDETSQIREVTL